MTTCKKKQQNILTNQIFKKDCLTLVAIIYYFIIHVSAQLSSRQTRGFQEPGSSETNFAEIVPINLCKVNM